MLDSDSAKEKQKNRSVWQEIGTGGCREEGCDFKQAPQGGFHSHMTSH